MNEDAFLDSYWESQFELDEMDHRSDPLDWEYIDDDGYEDWDDWVDPNDFGDYEDLLEGF